MAYAFSDNKTIFFLTSRHTQHHIVINTLKQIKEIIQQDDSKWKDILIIDYFAYVILNEFQRKNGLTESNYVDQNTILKLDAQIRDIEIRDIISNQFTFSLTTVLELVKMVQLINRLNISRH